MRVSANQVTIARLIGMPLFAALIYGSERMRVIGVIVGTLIGLTDFVDGYLARKHGSTVLGSLLDPVADKVFIVVCYMPFADRGGIPWGVAAAVISRELLVTVLRSSLELNGRRLPSSRLAKIKTWVQMIGVGLLVLMPIVGDGRGLTLFLGIPLVLTIIAALITGWFTGRSHSGLWFAAAVLATLLATARLAGTRVAEIVLIVIIISITWLSATDYLKVGVIELLRPQRYRALHWLRLVGGAVLPMVGLAAIAIRDVPAIPIIVLLSCEMARGALDNFVAHRGIADFSWGTTLWIEIVLVSVAMLHPPQAPALAILAAAVAVFTCVRGVVKQTRAASSPPAERRSVATTS